jgi:hypothetical protein
LEIHERKWISIQHVIFPKYNDLDILQEYKLENIIEIHNEILKMLDKLYYRFKELNNGVSDYTRNQKSVFCISNFLNTLKFENVLLENQIMLYINYISFFHYSQKKTLVRLYSKMTEFNKHIDEYTNIHNVISIDDINTVVSDDATNRRMTNDFYNDEYNVQLCNTPISEITENNSANDKNNKEPPLFKTPVHMRERFFESYKENVMNYERDLFIQVEESIDEVVKESIDEVVKESIDEVVKESFDEVVKESIHEVVKESIDEVVKESFDEVVKESFDEVVKEPLDELLEEQVDEVVKEQVDEVVKEQVDEVLEEPLDEVVKEQFELIEPDETICGIEEIKLVPFNTDSEEEEEYEKKIGMIEEFYDPPFPLELESTTHHF